MLVALAITWAFWAILIGLLVYWRRSWLPVLMFPVLISAGVWGLSCISDAAAVVGAGVLHGLLGLGLIIVAIRDRKPDDDCLLNRPPPEP